MQKFTMKLRKLNGAFSKTGSSSLITVQVCDILEGF